MALPTGPHRRYDPLSDQWVLVSAGRTKRPWQGSKERRASVEEGPSFDPGCYLCPGNTRVSGATNPEYASTYVFTNDFAALRPDAGDERLDAGLLRAEAQPGTCRVICFSPRHDLTLTRMEPASVREVIDMWAVQTLDLGRDWRWVQIFENRGAAMGASNPHPHGQIWSGAALPERGAREDASQRHHHGSTGRRLLLDVVEQEAGGVRAVEENEEWLALVPFWAVWPFETMLVPKRPAARIPDLDDAQRAGLQATMQRLMGRYDALFEQPMPFSMGWHQAPFDGSPTEAWQVHAHFMPPLLEATKRKFMVGYELLSEPQRDISAEDAAERLRAAVPTAETEVPATVQGGHDQEDPVTTAPLTERDAALARLADEEWDLLIIGGGIVGSGALLDATSRGLKAALVEQDDLAVGTSSRSSRLIHGGLRYLEDMRLQLVREALAERSRLLHLAPHLVRLERFLFPVYGWPLIHRAFMGAGLTLYDLLGAARDGGRAHHLDAGAVAELIPDIKRDGLRGGVTYSDGVEDDARYSISVARTAVSHGATVVTRARATEVLTDEAGAIRGVTVHDKLGDHRIEVRSRKVIDATGVWLSHPEARLGGSTLKLVPSRGTHLVFERDRLPLEIGMTLRVPGRVVFVIPYPNAWLVGTTDVGDDGAPDRPAPTIDEVDEILDNVNDVLDADLARDDAVGAFTGLRPLVGAPGGDTARVSREHTIHREESGLVRVSGGKYTTYRLMARDAVDYVLEGDESVPPSRTATMPLLGAATREQLDALAGQLAHETGLDLERMTALVERHGEQAREVVSLGREVDLLRPLGEDRTELEAEVAWAVEQEYALSLDDVLSRRMRLSMSRRDRGGSLAPRVAQIAGDRLGWDAQQQAVEVSHYLEAAHREYDVPGA